MAVERLEHLAERRGVSFDAMVGWLEDSLDRSAAVALDPERDLPTEELRVLSDLGVDVSPLGPDEPDTRANTMRHYLDLLATGLSVAEAAERIGVSESRVRQLLGDRKLYGIRPSGRAWVLPDWQFTPHGPIPGIDHVLVHIDHDEHPLAITAFFVTPVPELDGESPVSWLRSGGAAGAVVDLTSLLALP